MGLEASHDNIAAFLKKEVENIQEGLRPLHNPELLLAPVSTPQSAVDLLKQHNPDISAMIAEPLQRLEAAGRSMLSNGPTSEHRAHGRSVNRRARSCRHKRPAAAYRRPPDVLSARCLAVRAPAGRDAGALRTRSGSASGSSSASMKSCATTTRTRRCPMSGWPTSRRSSTCPIANATPLPRR